MVIKDKRSLGLFLNTARLYKEHTILYPNLPSPTPDLMKKVRHFKVANWMETAREDGRPDTEVNSLLCSCFLLMPNLKSFISKGHYLDPVGLMMMKDSASITRMSITLGRDTQRIIYRFHEFPTLRSLALHYAATGEGFSHRPVAWNPDQIDRPDDVRYYLQLPNLIHFDFVSDQDVNMDLILFLSGCRFAENCRVMLALPRLKTQWAAEMVQFFKEESISFLGYAGIPLHWKPRSTLMQRIANIPVIQYPEGTTPVDFLPRASGIVGGMSGIWRMDFPTPIPSFADLRALYHCIKFGLGWNNDIV